MNEYFKSVAAQATAILLAAFGAALISFFSSIAGQTGLECTPVTNPEEAGALGAIFKSIHSALVMARGTIHT